MKDLSPTAIKIMSVFEKTGTRENEYLSEKSLMSRVRSWSTEHRAALDGALNQLVEAAFIRRGKRLGFLLTVWGQRALSEGLIDGKRSGTARIDAVPLAPGAYDDSGLTPFEAEFE